MVEIREIKFRVWNKIYKKYVEINELEMGVKSLAIKFITPSGRTLYLEHGNSIILEQYIGVKDKNGIEIYEGDILKTDYDSYRVVEYGVHEYECNPHHTIEIVGYDFTNFDYLSKLEVVGNINLNGDLIEGQITYAESIKNFERIADKYYNYQIHWFDYIERVDAQFIKNLRETLELTQGHFARILGVKRKKIMKWEKGKKIPQPMKLLFYAIHQDNSIVEYVYKITFNERNKKDE